MIENEIWKTYPEFDWIKASSLGRYRTITREVLRKNGWKYTIKGQILKPQRTKDGYMRLRFNVNGKLVSRSAHRITATTFLPNPDNLPQVNHRNCIRTDNRVENLEWVTLKENISYRDKCGHTARNNATKLPAIAINIKTLEVLWFHSQHEAGRELGIDNSNINNVIKSKRKTSGGFWFCHVDKDAVEKTQAKFGNSVASKVAELMKYGEQ